MMATSGLDADTARSILSTMVRIRVFEGRVEELFAQGRLPGFVHVYLGEEAIAAGVCAALHADDYITSTHRGHGHAIAKGIGLSAIMAELHGKATGACRGRGGSMHLADFSIGMLGANGIVGGGFGIATGAALSARYRGTDQVAVCFFGDGGINKGTFHEAANFATVHRLPVIFACENNQFAQFTARHRTTSVDDLSERAAGYGMRGFTVDGNDPGAVYAATAEAVAVARQGEGPTLLNLMTYRFGGHYVGDAEVYRDRADVESRKEADPIERWEAELLDVGVLTEDDRSRLWEAARSEVAAAEKFAEESPDPDPVTALDDVFTGAGDG